MQKKIKVLFFSLLFLTPFAAYGVGCDQWVSARELPVRGVVVVSHGLNLLPSQMSSLSHFFSSVGYDVLQPAFRGHCGSEQEYLSVTSTQWEEDARRIHHSASLRAIELGVPLYLVAYSFSSLLFEALEEELPFKRKIYFAPALAMHLWYPLVIFIANLFPDFTFKSMNLENYAANPRSSFRSVLALDDFYKKWSASKKSNDHASGLIWVDPQDELVSIDGLKDFVGSKRGWKLQEIENQGSVLERKFHHLIINEEAVGKKLWEKILNESLQFLVAP